MMNPTHHLIVEEGPDKGLKITIPATGARLGRSSQNDVVLTDPLLSRHHCRLEFRSAGDLWVADLASANQTLVNGQVIAEQRLNIGDRVTIGDTTVQVLRNTLQAEVDAVAPPTPAATSGESQETPVVDLGLAPEPRRRAEATGSRKISPQLLTGAAAVLILLLGIVVFHMLAPKETSPATLTSLRTPKVRTLELYYEKVEGSAENVFRYALSITPDQRISIAIDDLMNGRHDRREAVIQTNLVQELIKEIEAAGFFSLENDYAGYQIKTHDTWDLTVVIDRLAHHVRVANRTEPDAFRTVRERIETFGRIELGLWAIPFTRETLISKAHEEYLLGKKLYDERQIEHGNLAGSIQHFQLCDIHLETVEPKPDFYADGLASMRIAEADLQRLFEDQSYRADRALRLKDWEQAAAELRIVLELVPNESDQRYRDARRKLEEVEMRLKTGR